MVRNSVSQGLLYNDYSRGSIERSAIKRLPTIQRQDTEVLAEELSVSHSVKSSECINNFGEYRIYSIKRRGVY